MRFGRLGGRARCGGRGCLEQLVSGRVLDEVARSLGLRHAGELDEAARGGSGTGGGLMASGRLLPRLVLERWPAGRPPWSAAELRVSRLGADAGLYGAGLLAVQLAPWPPPGWRADLAFHPITFL